MNPAKLNKLPIITISIATFLIPLFFLNIVTNTFDINKLLVLELSCVILLVHSILKTIGSKELNLKIHPLLIGFGLLVLSLILSLLFASPNKIESFIKELAPALFSFLFLFFSINLDFTHKQKELIKKSLLGSTTALSAFAIIQQLFGSFIPANYNSSSNFTPASNQINLIFLLILGFTLTGTLIYQAVSNPNNPSVKKYISLSILGILAVAHLIAGFFSIQKVWNQAQATMPPSLSWVVLLESLKHSPLVGFGPGNYIDAYTQYRPISSNTNQLWNIRYTAGHNAIFHYGTVAGIIGLASYLLFLGITGRYLLKGSREISLFVLVGILGHLLIPSSIITLFTLSICILIYINTNRDHIFSWKISITDPEVIITISSICTLIVLGLGYLSFRLYSGEVKFKQAIDLINSGKGIDGYNLLAATVRSNPYIAAYHSNLSRTSWLLANSLSQNKNLSDKDKETITKLIEQAINESKTAIGINPRNSTNWVALAQMYTRLIPSVKEAESWATTAYNQALNLDPNNPLLFMELGSMYFNLNKIELAATAFSNAIYVQPRFINAHYNLAIVFKTLKKYDQAKAELEKVKELLDPSSPDIAKIEKEIIDINSLAPSLSKNPESTQSSEIRAPQPLPTPFPTGIPSNNNLQIAPNQ